MRHGRLLMLKLWMNLMRFDHVIRMCKCRISQRQEWIYYDTTEGMLARFSAEAGVDILLFSEKFGIGKQISDIMLRKIYDCI